MRGDSRARPDRDLDFIVIGVQKGGTTSLWQHLRNHPRIAMPGYKEAPVFCEAQEEIPAALARLMDSALGEAPQDAMLGKAATYYMMGVESADVDLVADRIAQTFPKVRLIALLRDPIERAMSHYRMLVRRGVEIRPFDAIVEQLLQPEQLEAGRMRPNRTNSYLAQGEYARILHAYRARFPAEQIHTVSTAAFEREPGEVIDDVLTFLGLPPGYRPADLGLRHYTGAARARLDPEGEAQLRKYMAENVWPKVTDRAERDRLEAHFDAFLRSWNMLDDTPDPPLSDRNRKRLEAHYRRDGDHLQVLGVEASWLELWRAY